MKLIIDTRNGISGDIFCSGLLSLGAEQEKVVYAMEYAGNFIGETNIEVNKIREVYRLLIRTAEDRKHMHEAVAKSSLDKIIKEIGLEGKIKSQAYNVLHTLCEAESYVHSTDQRLVHVNHKHNHHQNHHHHNHGSGATLHEAKDILIDIAGMAAGLSSLGIHEIQYLDYVNVGNGSIKFSHGVLEVPAPATRYILEEKNISWKKSSDFQTEMATPTGVSIVAGLSATRVEEINEKSILSYGKAGGTKKNLPPVSFYLIS